MIKQTLLTALCLLCALLQGQDTNNDNWKIGLHYASFGDYIIHRDEDLIGSPSTIGKDFFTIGFDGVKPITKWLELETGLEYTRYKFRYESMLPPNPPFHTQVSKIENTTLFNIPILLRLNFLKYLFVNGGFLLDFDLSSSHLIDSQSGIGSQLGIGVKYDFKMGVSVLAQTYYKAHSLIAYSPADHQQKIAESGFSFGVTYQLK